MFILQYAFLSLALTMVTTTRVYRGMRKIRRKHLLLLLLLCPLPFCHALISTFLRLSFSTCEHLLPLLPSPRAVRREELQLTPTSHNTSMALLSAEARSEGAASFQALRR